VGEHEDYDWLAFFLSFIFAAIPAWIIVGAVVWKYSPYTDGSTIFSIATITSLVIGVIAGVWRSGFWGNARKIASFSPYTRKDKK
jgi:hypothetical protein